MIVRIVVEVILAALVLIAGSSFWQLYKRTRFLRLALCNEALLRKVITTDALNSTRPDAEILMEKIGPGYALNLKTEIDAYTASHRRVLLIVFAVLLLALISSFFIAGIYLLVNLALLFLLLFEPLSNAAKKSALQHVLILGLILRKWRQENPTECDDWIEQAWTLQPLYDAIKDASA